MEILLRRCPATPCWLGVSIRQSRDAYGEPSLPVRPGRPLQPTMGRCAARTSAAPTSLDPHGPPTPNPLRGATIGFHERRGPSASRDPRVADIISGAERGLLQCRLLAWRLSPLVSPF